MAALALYAYTTAPWLTWAHEGADGGDLISAAMTWGVPHPSGYPTYCLLGRAFALLPLGNIAHRFNLFSASAATAAVVLIYLAALQAIGEQPSWQERASAFVAALALVYSPVFWSQAIISEVYALNALFVASCLYLALQLKTGEHPPYLWGLLGLSIGLGMGSHLTILFLLPGLLWLLWPQLQRSRSLALLVGLALGLGVFLYLPLAARRDPPINWGDAHTWKGFWWLVSGQAYRGYIFGLPWRYFPSRLASWAQLWGKQFTWPGLALALWGLGSWLEEPKPRLALGSLFSTALYSVYAITYDTTDSYIYLLPTYLISALWLAQGAKLLLLLLRKRGLPLLSGLLLLVLPFYSLGANYASLNLHHDHLAQRWANQVLQQAPPHALLITGEDRHTFTLSYTRWVEKRRPDLLLVDGELLAHPWYVRQLVKRYPSLAPLQKAPSLKTLLSLQLGQRPIYLTSPRPELEETFYIAKEGDVLWKVTFQR
ncbi:MAG: DUF2723 domain-containing protein [Anaerolineae bacterium]|nr:DUF2723 domain-containing protein [Anaerolineae bacterium]